MPWEAFADLRWVVNGVSYRRTLRELFELSYRLLDPRRLAQLPVLVSHGDAHNANVWMRRDEGGRPGWCCSTRRSPARPSRPCWVR